MRFSATTLAIQDLYPMQAEGGFLNGLHSSLTAALKAWEARRMPQGTGFRYGRAAECRHTKPKATREEISWNPAPEVKRPPNPQRERERLQRLRERNRERMAQRRLDETPEAKAERLEARRAAYAAMRGDKYKAGRAKQTPQERLESIRSAKKRYMAKVRAGIPTKKYKPLQTNADRLKAKAERQRRYYAEFRQKLAQQRIAKTS